jgi:hypothetical protein
MLLSKIPYMGKDEIAWRAWQAHAAAGSEYTPEFNAAMSTATKALNAAVTEGRWVSKEELDWWSATTKSLMDSQDRLTKRAAAGSDDEVPQHFQRRMQRATDAEIAATEISDEEFAPMEARLREHLSAAAGSDERPAAPVGEKGK